MQSKITNNMAQTEIYAYLKCRTKRKWYFVAGVSNAWEGCMRLWYELERKYLPSYRRYDSEGKLTELCKEYDDRGEYYSRINLFCNNGRKEIQEVWDLEHDFRLSYAEINVMRSTLDRAMIISEDIPLFVECLRAVAAEHGGNFSEQADALQNYYEKNKNLIVAIAYNQTSVCCADDIFGHKMDEGIDNFWDCIISKDFYKEQVRLIKEEQQ